MNSPVRPTTLIDASRLADRLGLRSLTLAAETFQVTGSFKFRAAYNLASNIDNPLVIAASSGNFGQAVACACRMVGKRAIIVMPGSSARVKIDAVRSYGAEADLIDTALISREARVAELAAANPQAYIGSAFDDDYVIEGNATLGLELAAITSPKFDAVVAPVGGGGLTSGLIKGLSQAGRSISVIGAEPQIANDAARSLQAGEIISNEQESLSMADGARTRSVGKRNWAILQHGIHSIIEVPEENIAQGVRTLFADVNLKAEPTGALSVGAIITDPKRFEGQNLCCIISGGNVDPDTYIRIIAGS